MLFNFQVSENMDNHYNSSHNSLSAKHPFLSRPDFSCCLCLPSDKFITADVSSIMTHLMREHSVKQEKALLSLCSLDIDSDEDDVGDDILVPLVNLFASSESSSDDDETEHLEEQFGIDQLDVDPEEIDCVSQSSDGEDLDRFADLLECELCEEKSCISPRELCLHLSQEHKLGWDKKSEMDCRSAEYGCYLCTFKCREKSDLKLHLTNDHTHLGNKCRFCPVRFKEHKDRDRHQLEQHSDQQHNFYQCPICHHVSTSTVRI